ncbi:hypothetical protein MBLNU457_g0463t1 [Dothideomycetes sp. NU457]
MELPIDLEGGTPVQCVDMHTSGEPTRIIYRGYPELTGPLQAQLTEAQQKFDHNRKCLMLEPRGHADMYGALLRPHTELTAEGKAHIGVLFLTGEGYSTMCGHATIALGRFLIDTHDKTIFPLRDSVPIDPTIDTATITLHAPCGLVTVTVPVTPDSRKSDPSRPVSFLSVPSFVSCIDLNCPVSSEYVHGLHALIEHSKENVKASVAYGGAWYLLPKLWVDPHTRTPQLNMRNLALAAFDLKETFNNHPWVRKAWLKFDKDNRDSESGYIFGTIITQPLSRTYDASRNADGADFGLNFFGKDQFDRSPCGSGIAAREALAFARKERKIGQRWVYHSLVSKAKGQGEMVATIESECKRDGSEGTGAVRVRIEGKAFYTGFASYVVEGSDEIGKGFSLKDAETAVNGRWTPDPTPPPPPRRGLNLKRTHDTFIKGE